MRSNIKLKLTPSFCNHWPQIRITVNDCVLWENFVEHVQNVEIEFNTIEWNTIKIEYLNKRHGPAYWDTEVDEQGNIVRDQNCILSDILIGNSRCDFLIHNMEFQGLDGTRTSGLNGFMSKQGFFEICFPENIYDWIVDSRFSKIMSNNNRSSSLNYFQNYMANNKDPETELLISEIKQLLKQV